MPVKSKFVYQCARCGTEWPEDYEAEWGKKYGNGVGPSPVCSQLVPITEDPTIARGLCRGVLVPVRA